MLATLSPPTQCQHVGASQTSFGHKHINSEMCILTTIRTSVNSEKKRSKQCKFGVKQLNPTVYVSNLSVFSGNFQLVSTSELAYYLKQPTTSSMKQIGIFLPVSSLNICMFSNTCPPTASYTLKFELITHKDALIQRQCQQPLTFATCMMFARSQLVSASRERTDGTCLLFHACAL